MNHLNEKHGFSPKKGFLAIDSHLEIIDLWSTLSDKTPAAVVKDAEKIVIEHDYNH